MTVARVFATLSGIVYRSFIVTLLAWSLGGLGSAAAAPPSKAELAERMHQRALTAIRANKLADAAELWEEAEAMHAHWKYAFNLTFCRIKQKQWLPAWAALRRATRAGLPEEHRERAAEVEKDLRTRLMTTHAWLEVRVEPPHATVRRNGAIWALPLEAWVSEASSVVLVESAGFETAKTTIEHAPGTAYRETIRLRAKARTGGLLVRGQPAGATVRLDDKDVGRLPEVRLRKLRAGPHVLRVTARGHLGLTRTITVAANETRTIDVTLERPIVAKPIPKPAPASNVWGWTALGVGVALGGGGAGMLGWAQSIADDAGELHDGDDYRDLESDFPVALYGGWGLVGLGAAALTTGIVLLVTGDEPDRAVDVEPWLSPDGGGVRAGIRFP